MQVSVDHQGSTMKRRNALKGTFYLVTAVLSSMLGCGDSADGDSTLEMEATRSAAQQVRAVRWKVYGSPAGREVRIISEVGYCAGTKKPKIQKVRVEEKAKRVLLTAFLTVVKLRSPDCAGVGLGVKKIVILKHPLGKRALYDAGVSPPARRWPRS